LLLGCEAFEVGGPIWVEAPDADRGYLDKYFTGWVDPAKLKLLDYATLADCSSPILTMRTRLVIPEH
jgi:hypothetical protein